MRARCCCAAACQAAWPATAPLTAAPYGADACNKSKQTTHPVTPTGHYDTRGASSPQAGAPSQPGWQVARPSRNVMQPRQTALPAQLTRPGYPPRPGSAQQTCKGRSAPSQAHAALRHPAARPGMPCSSANWRRSPQQTSLNPLLKPHGSLTPRTCSPALPDGRCAPGWARAPSRAWCHPGPDPTACLSA